MNKDAIKRRNSLLVECVLCHRAETYECARIIDSLPKRYMEANKRLWSPLDGPLIPESHEEMAAINSMLEAKIAEHRIEIGLDENIHEKFRELNCQLWKVLDRVSGSC